MLTEDVSWVEDAFKMVHGDELGSNSFPHTVEGQSIVAFVELCMWNSRTVNNRLVITKDIAFVSNWDTKVA